jgi:hypothetical protein
LTRGAGRRYRFRWPIAALSTEEGSMYSYVKNVGVPTFLVREAPAFGVSFIIAELFYKFGSFSLECLAFLATWYVLSWLQSMVLGRRGAP